MADDEHAKVLALIEDAERDCAEKGRKPVTAMVWASDLRQALGVPLLTHGEPE